MKRREFLKGMGLAGAAAVAGGAGAFGTLFTPRAARAAERDRLVFISDLHLNVAGPYAWMVDHAPDLAAFLNGLNTREDIAEVVILGDFLDDWVMPSDATPQTFSEVIAANVGNGVVPALQALCLNPGLSVTYVTGNHDMLSFEPACTDVIAAAFPGLNIVSDAPGLGAYTVDNVIWAEHGHRYALFNAPDTWSRTGGHLPLGYFISRLAASKSASSGELHTTPDVLRKFLKSRDRIWEQGADGGWGVPEGPIDDRLVFAIYRAVFRWSGHRAWDRFAMAGVDSFEGDPFVGGVGLTYDTILSGWPSRQNIVSSAEALLNDISLNGAANLLFQMPDHIKDLYPFTPRIVLFGHTHEAAFQYTGGEADTIYANTGTWVDAKPMTWVEVEISDAVGGGRDYTVELWFEGEATPRHAGTLTVGAH